MTKEVAFVLICGTIMASVIAAVALFVNDWLKRRWEKEKWLLDKKEEAYLACLQVLNKSRRVPYIHKGRGYLEVDSYNGLMDGIPHVPAWMTAMQCYSSNEAADALRPHCEKIIVAVKNMKAHERELTEITQIKDVVEYAASGEPFFREEVIRKVFVKEFGISRAVEDALPVVRRCLEAELLGHNMRISPKRSPK